MTQQLLSPFKEFPCLSEKKKKNISRPVLSLSDYISCHSLLFTYSSLAKQAYSFVSPAKYFMPLDLCTSVLPHSLLPTASFTFKCPSDQESALSEISLPESYWNEHCTQAPSAPYCTLFFFLVLTITWQLVFVLFCYSYLFPPQKRKSLVFIYCIDPQCLGINTVNISSWRIRPFSTPLINIY